MTHPFARFPRLPLIVVVLGMLLPTMPPAQAQPATPDPDSDCVVVEEPNDQPPDAIDLGSGPSCATAEHPNPSQDLYRWTIGDDDAESAWTFTISAIPANICLVEIYTVELDETGAILAATKLVSVRGEVDQPTVAANLLFQPGEYYVGIAASAPGPYEFSIREGDALPDAIAAGEDPVPVEDAFAVSGEVAETGVTLAWTIGDDEPAPHLDLAVRGPVGASFSWLLADDQGVRLYAATVATDGTSSLPDVGLAPGTYTLTLTNAGDVPATFLVSATAAAPRSPQFEDEPNEDITTASPIVFDGDNATVTGRLAALPATSGTDVYALTIDDTLANRLTDIRLLWQGGISRTLCLTDATGADLRCADGETGAAMYDFVLPAGSYFVRITGEPDPANAYTLKVDVTGEAVAEFEAEPNDNLIQATTMVPAGDGFGSAGRLTRTDSDYYRISVTGDPQLWLIEVTGETAGVDLLDVTGFSLLQADSDGINARIYDAFLVPGDHYIRVSGEPGDYTITATPLGPPDPAHEHEPNDAIDRSQPISLLEERTGRLATTSDYDYYRFALQDTTLVDLELELPSDAVVNLYLNRSDSPVIQLANASPGDNLRWTGMLAPGDYVLDIRATSPSLEPYRLTLTPLDPFQAPDDLEPNDQPHQAVPIPASLQVSGNLDPHIPSGDHDWYLVPPFDATQVAIDYTPEVTVAMWTVGDAITPSQILPSVLGTEAGGMLVDVPSGQPLLLEVTGTGPYDVALAPVDDPQSIVASPVADANPDLTASLGLGEAQPAAYWTEAQVITGTLRVTNDGSSELDLDLAAMDGHFAWDVTVADESVSVEAGETVDIAVEVRVAPDAWADQPVYVAVEASSDEGKSASAMALVIPSRTAPPLNAERWDPLPPELLGGLDVAWSGLGAQPVAIDEAAATEEAFLYDQLLNTGNGWQESFSGESLELTVDLAGDEPVPVAGIILFPPGSSDAPDTFVRGFELDLSLDGQAWDTVFTGELRQIPVEQAFALDAPVDARFARLRILSVHSANPHTATIGEWKVVAAPDWSPGPFEIGASTVGGHIVDIQPPLNNYGEVQLLAMPDGKVLEVEVDPGAPVTWTIGFYHDRAAQVTAITWVAPPESDPEARFDTVMVEVSTETPIGPWTTLGEFEIARDANGIATFTLDDPAWARFVRITGTVPEAEEEETGSVYWELPELVQVNEAPIDDAYRSILGEWGTYQSTAIYERQVEPEPITLDADAGNDAASATSLAPGDAVANSTAFALDEDWYRIEIPPGDGLLTLDLTGIPVLGATATLFDEDGAEVPVETTPISADSLHLEASVEPGATYLLHITQPPTSVVFAFDTSGSIGNLLPVVYQGLNGFAADVLPEREFVNILPFGEQLLLDEWSDQPYLLQGAIAAYPRTSQSSEAEEAILVANEGLAPFEGNRAIILITDAESGPTYDIMAELWPGLATVAPRIFSVNIAGSSDPYHGQDVMQDWSMVNSGQYVYVRDQGEMDVAFDRAATELRRPSIYTLAVQTEPPPATPTPEPTATPEPPPTPEPTATPAADGTLQVLAPEPEPGEPSTLPASEEGQVAIILDTSGSMLQGLGDQSRADIAKTALIDLVTTTIPPGTTVSLRTFGDTPESCETILVVPASPLDPEAMAETIANLPIVNLVRTPIGAALEAVADDLSGTSGPKIVVLVTDGEETCDGDPAAAIEALVASGIDVRVNIVGFAIDDPALEATFEEWAQIGNGQYIDAGNAEELDEAVAQAVLPTYEVQDESGDVVATGQVGADPVSLPPGEYTVVINSDPEIVIEDVVIESEEDTEVELPAP